MQRRIVVYGHGDKVSFGNEEEVKRYISEIIFSEEYQRRYRYTQRKQADVVVFSWRGSAYGTFDITGLEEPTAEDREEYPPVKQVYAVGESALFENPVRLKDVGVKGVQFGKTISEEKLKQIEELAGRITRFGGR